MRVSEATIPKSVQRKAVSEGYIEVNSKAKMDVGAEEMFDTSSKEQELDIKNEKTEYCAEGSMSGPREQNNIFGLENANIRRRRSKNAKKDACIDGYINGKDRFVLSMNSTWI